MDTRNEYGREQEMDMECLEHKKWIWEGTRDGYGVFRTQEINIGGNKRWIWSV